MTKRIIPFDLHLKLVDSALVIALCTAGCYMMGFLIKLRDSRALGLPSHLLPQHSIHSILFTGGSFLFYLVLIFLFLILVGFLIAKLLSEKLRGCILDQLKKYYNSHPTIYTVVGIAVFFSVFMLTPDILPMRTRYQDRALPLVISIETEQTSIGKNENLLYLSNPDGLIILKRAGRNSFLILKQSDIERIEIAQNTSKVPNDE